MLRLCSLIVTMALSMGGSAFAAKGIDCLKDTAEDEQAVCRDSGLLRLDLELANLYGQAVALYGNLYENPVRRTQRDWLRTRKTCGADTSCLQRIYLERLQELRTFLSPPEPPPPPPPPQKPDPPPQVAEPPRPPPAPPPACTLAATAACVTLRDPVIERRGNASFVVYRFDSSCEWTSSLTGEDSRGVPFEKAIGPGGTAAVECQWSGGATSDLCTGLKSWSVGCTP